MFFALIFLLVVRKSASGITESALTEADYIVFGASIIDEGHAYYPDWCAFMLREFDDPIKPNLERWFQGAKYVVNHPREDWTTAAKSFLDRERGGA